MDIMIYEVGSRGQYEDDSGEVVAKSFDYVSSLLDQKVREVCALVWGTEPPLCFISMSARTKKRHARKLERKVKRLEKSGGNEEEIDELKAKQVYKPNFRENVSKKKVYKGTRKESNKPLHYDNLTEYILANYDCVMAEGLEADDLLSIHQRTALKNNPTPTTIICTRDKDLRMVPGMHFGWECGKQAQFGPELVEEYGRLNPIYRGKTAKGEPRMAELKGTGMSFFCAQLLVGDSVDNIPGLPKCGPKKAYEALQPTESVEEMFEVVGAMYEDKFGEGWREELLEQGRLLWMLDDLNEDGSPKMWELPEVISA